MANLKKNRKFSEVVKNKKIPILTLDSRWHEIFPEHEKTRLIRNLEASINELLKKQGKLVNDIKDMKKLKKELINDIVDNMETSNNLAERARQKRLIKNKDYIVELNNKIKEDMDALSQVPYQIREENEKLMVESVKVCYNKLAKNSSDISQLSDLILKLQQEIDEGLKKKEGLEVENDLIYSYMHDMLGADAMEQLD